MKATSPTKDMKVFGIAMGVVLGALGAWQFVKGRPTAGAVLVGVGAAFLLAAIFAVALLRPLYVPWMKLAFVLGFVMTRVVLSVFYFLVITPFGILRRVFAGDALERRICETDESWWKERDGTPPPPERYERQF